MKKLVCICLLIGICILLSALFPLCVSGTNYDEFTIYDYKDDTCYTIHSADGIVTLRKGDNEFSFTYLYDIVNCTAYRGTVTLYSYYTTGEGFDRYLLTFIDTSNQTVLYTQTPFNTPANNYICTVTNNRDIYLRSSEDSRSVQIYTHERENYRIETGAEITQLLCIDGASVLVITNRGVYSIDGESVTQLSSNILLTPCSYRNGVITDNDGNKYSYNDTSLSPYSDTSLTESSENSGKDYNSSVTTTTIVEENHIIIDSGITLAALREELGINRTQISVTSTEGKAVTSGKLGTGMKALIEDNEYIIIVRGDLTGEGHVNSRDLKALMKHLTKEELLNIVQQEAADIDSSGTLNTKDLLLLSKIY